MHGIVHDFIVSQTIKEWRDLPTGHGGGAPISSILKIDQEEFETRIFPRILEIGSLDINGAMETYNFINSRSAWKDMVGCKEYIGIDLMPGRGVHHVMDAHDILFKDNTFDAVLCMNMLEHDSDIQKTLFEGYRVLKPGGLFLVTTVDETHPEHMEEQAAELNLPYNHITENDLKKMILKIKPKAWKMWHFPSDLLVRIEK